MKMINKIWKWLYWHFSGFEIQFLTITWFDDISISLFLVETDSHNSALFYLCKLYDGGFEWDLFYWDFIYCWVRDSIEDEKGVLYKISLMLKGRNYLIW